MIIFSVLVSGQLDKIAKEMENETDEKMFDFRNLEKYFDDFL
jgi:hypothetical protein